MSRKLRNDSMKTKTMLGIASLMVFGAALFMGLAVVAIFFLTNQNTSDEVVLLFDGYSGEVTRIHLNNGSSETFSLGLSLGNSYIGGRAFSSDGRLMGFCVIDR